MAGAISMGVGGYLSAKTEYDHYRSMQRLVRSRVQFACACEMESEVASIMDPYGVSAQVAKALCADLIEAERQAESTPSSHIGTPMDAMNMQVRQPQRKGLTPFLLHVGRQLEPVSAWRMFVSALTIGLSYLLGGFVPLVPYLFCQQIRTALFISIGVTGAALFLFGAVKQPLVDLDSKDQTRIWSWRTIASSALSTLAVGGAAAAACYGIVHAIEGRMHAD